jgi:hypothetical protein
MARLKPYDHGQMKFIPVSFERQILPGTFESTRSRPDGRGNRPFRLRSTLPQ